ncbi:MAG TPA: hypothetical protein VK640_11860 [Actinomycetes bacterium]|nr:hypothetical protein [Actinomycetes bacterium]
MNAAARLTVFAAVLLAAFGSAWAVGAAVGPADAPETDTHAEADRTHSDGGGDGGHGDDSATLTADDGALPGLASTVDGYTLVPLRPTLPSGDAVRFAFRVTGPDGSPVTDYTEAHEKDLHLIVVRRDLSQFQHVHPVLSGDGVWSVDLDLTRAGSYRAYADVVPADLGRNLVLGTDLDVAGEYRPVALPAAATSISVDGFDVRMTGHPEAGVDTDLTFTVSRDGEPVDDLQPYLGAYGHLVTLRAGDLAYLHTHPGEDAEPGVAGGPDVEFMTTFPSPGTYRLFLDFQVNGEVRTAELTVDVGEHR